MALRVRRTMSRGGGLLPTLMMVLALAVQPLYGVMAGSVAHAETQSIRKLAVTTAVQVIAANEASAPINVQTQNGGGQESALDEGKGNGAHLMLSSSSSTGQFSNANTSNGLCTGEWNASTVTMSAASANKAFCYRDSTPGVYTLTVNSDITLNGPNSKIAPATQQITVKKTVVALPTPVVNGENFNTNDSAAYKGINVGFNVKDFGTVSSVKVSLYKDDVLLVENTGTPALNNLINSGETHLSTPFYIQGGTADAYWNFGVRSWTVADKPTKAVITVTGANGAKSTTLTPLAEPNGWTFESLLPPADTTKPTITFTNPARFNDASYNKYFSAGPDITIAASDASGIKSTVLHIYKADKTPAKYCDVTYAVTTSCDTSSFTEGDYYVIAAATDDAGNSVFVTKYFSIDTTRPTAHIDSPAEGTYSKTGNLTVEGTASDGMSGIDHVYVYVAHDPWADGGYEVNRQAAKFDDSTGKFTFDVSNLPEGTFVVKAVAYDKAGNLHFANAVHIMVDKTRPSVAFVNPVNFSKPFATGPVIAMSVSDENGSGVSVTALHVYRSDDNSATIAWCNNALTCDTSKLPDGNYYVRAGATDKAGNNQTIRAEFTVDGTRPSARITSPSDNSYNTTGNLTIRGVATDNETYVDHVNIYVSRVTAPDANGKTFGGYVVDNQPATYNPSTKVFSFDRAGLMDGTYIVKAVAFDAAGNYHFASGAARITVDTTAPTNFMVTAPSPDSRINGTVYTAAGTVDGAQTVQLCVTPAAGGQVVPLASCAQPVAVADATSGTWSLSIPTDHLLDGHTYHLTFTASDAAGNTATISRDVTFDNTAPTVSNVTVAPSQLTTKTPVTVKGLLSDFADLTSLELYVTGENGTASRAYNITPYVDPISGAWSFTLPDALPQGSYVVGVRASDGVNTSDTATMASMVAFMVAPYVAPVVTTPGQGATSPNTPGMTPSGTRPSVVSTGFGVVPAAQSFAAGSSRDDTAVLGASTTKDAAQADNGSVKGADTSAAPSQKPTAKLLGLAWYWWLLLLAVVAAVAYAIAGRRSREA